MEKDRIITVVLIALVALFMFSYDGTSDTTGYAVKNKGDLKNIYVDYSDPCNTKSIHANSYMSWGRKYILGKGRKKIYVNKMADKGEFAKKVYKNAYIAKNGKKYVIGKGKKKIYIDNECYVQPGTKYASKGDKKVYVEKACQTYKTKAECERNSKAPCVQSWSSSIENVEQHYNSNNQNYAQKGEGKQVYVNN